jgi:amino acid transporter
VALLSIFSSFVTALVFATVVRLVTYIACCLALLKLRRGEGASPGFRAPAGALLAIVGIVVAAIVLATSAGRELGMTVLALMLGLPFLWLARRGR